MSDPMEQERRLREVLASVLADVPFTPIQKRIVNTLADGKSHDAKTMARECIDSQATKENLTDHINFIRRKIAHLDHLILCEYRARTTYYRYVLSVNYLVSS